MSKKLFFGIVTFIIVIIIGVLIWKFSPGLVSCNKETKECPNGLTVGRIGPNCEFAECSSLSKLVTIMQCAEKEIGEGYPKCSEDFNEKCAEKGGSIRTIQLHYGGPNMIFECREKALDAGKPCAFNGECSAGCNLKNAIDTGACKFVKKSILKEEASKSIDYLRYDAEDFYVSTYSCSTERPGTCKDGTESVVNIPGMTISYKMDGFNLIERRMAGPVY
jgi:hypothetical protein